MGISSERTAPLALSPEQAARLAPQRVAVLWPGRNVPLALDPLLTFRESELTDEMLFLNRDRNGRQVEYLSYTTGRIGAISKCCRLWHGCFRSWRIAW